MPSSKYHKDQANLLAGLALTADSPEKARQFNLAAMEHLEQAQLLDSSAADGTDAQGTDAAHPVRDPG